MNYRKPKFKKFKMVKGTFNYFFDDFIENPTNMSKHILELAKRSQNKYNLLLHPRRLRDKVKLRLLYLNEYSRVYLFINNFLKKDLPDDIDNLIKELTNIFDHVALNNILLAYSFLIEKNKENPILTREDEKLLYLKKLYNNEISFKEFNNVFGHYALNPFELSSKRFNEYSKKEIMRISKFLKEFDSNKKISLKDYLENKKKNLFAIYSTLREELKYIALLVINNLRLKFLKIQKKEKIKDIFNMSYDDIRRKGYC